MHGKFLDTYNHMYNHMYVNNGCFYERINNKSDQFEFNYQLVSDCGSIGILIQSDSFKGMDYNCNKILLVVVYKNRSYILESFDVITTEIMEMCEDTFRTFLAERLNE